MDCFLLEVFDSRGSSDQQVEINLSADALRLLLQQTDVNRVIDKKGNTALHRLSVYPRELPTPVYVLAQQGALVNKQNDEGETPLHAAVRADNYLVTEALLHCGADSTITNKIGTSVLDLCRGSMKELVRKFNPPLHQAVSAGNFAMVCKLLRNWVSVTSICVGSSESVLDWAKTWHTEEVFVLRCLQKISEHKNQSVLIHSLLANDTTAVRKVLEETKMRSVNSRYKEMSLLSIALENKNKQLVQLLLDHGVKTNCRVQHRLSGGEDSVPCVLVAYSYTPDLTIAQLLWYYGIHGRHELDKEGNTALIRAIIHGASLHFIEWAVNQTEGYTLARRNVEKLTAREVCEKIGRQDVRDYLDQYVKKHAERLAPILLAQSYPSLPPPYAEKYLKIAKVIETLFTAAKNGDVGRVTKYNTANYQDVKGHTVLHKAITCKQLNVVKGLVNCRPALKSISDNHGRYPLHFAFLLPDSETRQEMLLCLLQSNAECYEMVTDKDGLRPAEYSLLPEETKQSIIGEVGTGP